MIYDPVTILCMTPSQLRDKHPRLVYQQYEITEASGSLTIRFHFLLEPDVRFISELTIPTNSAVDRTFIEPFVFSLGMVEAISYWKAACPPELVVEAGNVTPDQIAWWHDLFLNGLGEFFYKNNIDFTKPDFLTITSHGPRPSTRQPVNPSTFQGDLIMVGGGKDSAVTLELLKKMPTQKNVLLLNPTSAALNVSKVAGFNNPMIIKRTIDPKLLELNKLGYLNGHTPFSAYLAFLGVLVATIHGYKNVIASNESSASEGNVEYQGKTINHQYSKSYDFEKKFRERPGLSGPKGQAFNSPEYFSFLRPLSELQIAELFSKMTRYHKVFTSCNVSRGNGWCGACPKCAFVYLMLSPFLSNEKMIEIFGSDFFDKPQLQTHFLDLTGAGDKKPFDCVGTPQDTQGALALLAGEPLDQPHWNTQHYLPQQYEEVLRLAESKNILLLGYGRENQSAEKFLAKHFPHIQINIVKQFDAKKPLPQSDIIIRSPGIQKDRFSGEYVTTATNIFFSMCPGITIGVTGTKGKSTTSALIARILHARLVGNIGNPALDALDGATDKTIFVVELSSHQLEDARRSPHVAVVLNVFPEHMDYYKTFDQYVAAKKNIVKFQTENDVVVYDDTNEIASKIAQQGIGKKIPVSETAYDGNDVNIRAAMIVAALFDVPRKQILDAVASFQTLPHRLEFVGEFKGIRFYNDSLATVPEATIRALTTLGDDVTTLIAGGFDRGLDYAKLGEFLAKRKTLKTLILFPDTGKKIQKALAAAGNMSHVSYHMSQTMKDAVSLAYAHTPPGKICLLSPASASFNLFKDYEDRGNQFKNLVMQHGSSVGLS